MSNPHFYHDLNFPASKQGGRPFVAMNMVSSIDGKITKNGTQPKSLGSSFDLMTMGVIRSHFDAVLAGGNTIRLHPYYLGVPSELEDVRQVRGLARQPLTILLTGRGKLDPASSLFTNPPAPPVIITSSDGAKNLASEIKAKSQVEIMEHSTPQQITSLLQEKYQVQRLLLEGGPSVNYQFMQAKLLDELFLTLHPSLIGKSSDLNLARGEDALGDPDSIKLVSINQHQDELFLRYAIKW